MQIAVASRPSQTRPHISGSRTNQRAAGSGTRTGVCCLGGKADGGLLLGMRQQVIQRRADARHEIDLIGEEARKKSDQSPVDRVERPTQPPFAEGDGKRPRNANRLKNLKAILLEESPKGGKREK